MVRRWPNLGLAMLLLTGLCLPIHELRAQSNPPQSAPATTPQPKTRAHRKKAAPEPPVQQTPAPPPTLEQSAPSPPQVTYNNGQLTIIAQNATLSQVLRSVQSLTGASVEMPSGASSERVAGQLGPGQPRDVLNALLHGTKFNYIILGVNGNPGAVQRVILTTARPMSAVNTAQNNAAPPQQEEPQDEDNIEPEPPPGPQPVPPSIRHRPPNVPGAFVAPPQPQPQPQPDTSVDNSQPGGAKSPEQLLQELQQMQQQQQQLQDQLNPANRPQQ